MEQLTEKLIHILEENARYSVSELSSMLDVDEQKISTIMEKLEADGIICGYKAIVDWDKFSDAHVTALIEIKVTPQRDAGFEEIAEKIMEMDEVESVYLMSGGFDLCATVQGKTFKDVALFVAKRLAVMDNVISTATHFVLRRYKELGVALLNKQKDDRGVMSL